MGAGRDGAPVSDQSLGRKWSFDKLKNLSSVKNDLVVLKHIWFSRARGDDHAERLEHFYGPQAAACELALHHIAVLCVDD
jgi:betaine lipid synthase